MNAVELEWQRLDALLAIRSCLLRLKWLSAATRFEIALRRHDRALKLAYKYGYNPAQPRDDHGRWTDTGGGLTRVAGGGRLIGGGRSRYGVSFPGATNGQLVRLDLNIARAENALQQIRQYDQNWKPRTESATAFPRGIEGAIADSEARAVEAEARLEQFRTGIGGNFGPRLDPAVQAGSGASQVFDGEAWINVYRATNKMPDLFGRPMWPNDRGTVAVTEIDGKLYFGINSSAPGYSTADRNDANTWRWTLVNTTETLAQRGNIGSMPNDSFYHAEATILLRAARENEGSLSGRAFEVYVDRPLCTSCDTVLPWLGLQLGDPMVTFINTRTGVRSIMWGGRWLR